MSKQIIFLTLGTKGDLYPFLGIAKELRQRGYPVLFLSSDDHRRAIEAEDLEFESVQTSEEHQAFLGHPDTWKPVKGLKLYLKEAALGTAKRAYLAIETRSREVESVLITNNTLLGGLLAHEKLRIPTASVFLHPFSHLSVVDPAKDTPFHNFALRTLGLRGRKLVLDAYLSSLNRVVRPINTIRSELEMEPVKDILGSWRHSVDLILDLWPEWFGPDKPDWPRQAIRTGFVVYDGPDQIRSIDWRQDLMLRKFLDREPIVFTMGSEMIQNFDHHLKLFSEACRLAQCPGLFVSPALKDERRIDVGPDFTVIDSAPFSSLFERSRAVVTHGGIGTVARAIAAAKPTLVTPMAYDQFDNGFQIERLGAGRTQSLRSLTAPRLAELLREITGSDIIKANARLYARRIQISDGIRTAADLIENRLLFASNTKREKAA